MKTDLVFVAMTRKAPAAAPWWAVRRVAHPETVPLGEIKWDVAGRVRQFVFRPLPSRHFDAPELHVISQFCAAETQRRRTTNRRACARP